MTTKTDATRRKLICLDPGHGGGDSGAVGPNTTRECDINWAIVEKAKVKLDAAGFNVFVTKGRDETIRAGGRMLRANATKANLLVSVHCNANGSTATGHEVWCWHESEPSSRMAKIMRDELIRLFPDLPARPLKQSSPATRVLTILQQTNMPAVLLECAFISNPSEEKLLLTDDAQDKFAEAIVETVKRMV